MEVPCSALEVLGGLLKVFHVGGAGCCAGGAFRVGALLGGLLGVFHAGGAERFAGGVG